MMRQNEEMMKRKKIEKKEKRRTHDIRKCKRIYEMDNCDEHRQLN